MPRRRSPRYPAQPGLRRNTTPPLSLSYSLQALVGAREKHLASRKRGLAAAPSGFGKPAENPRHLPLLDCALNVVAAGCAESSILAAKGVNHLLSCVWCFLNDVFWPPHPKKRTKGSIVCDRVGSGPHLWPALSVMRANGLREAGWECDNGADRSEKLRC